MTQFFALLLGLTLLGMVAMVAWSEYRRRQNRPLLAKAHEARRRLNAWYASTEPCSHCGGSGREYRLSDTVGTESGPASVREVTLTIADDGIEVSDG